MLLLLSYLFSFQGAKLLRNFANKIYVLFVQIARLIRTSDLL